MATSIAIVGTTSGTEVDVSTDKALFAELRSPGISTLGVYTLGANTGSIAATLGSGATVFSLRWGNATNLCLIRKLTVIGVVNAQITAAVRSDLQLFVARGFTASDSTQSSILPASGMNELRSSMGSTLVTDLRISNTGGITAGTRTLDTNPIGRVLGFFQSGAGGVGTYIYGNYGGYATLLDRTYIGAHPLVLAQNEGIVVTTSAAGPATGTFVLNFNIEWLEVPSY